MYYILDEEGSAIDVVCHQVAEDMKRRSVRKVSFVLEKSS